MEKAGFDVESLRNPGASWSFMPKGRLRDRSSHRCSRVRRFRRRRLRHMRPRFLIEANLDLVQMADLGYGRCRFVVAEPREAKARPGSLCQPREHSRDNEVSRITQAYYDRIGQQVDIVTLHGNIELGPMVGIADRIVDITATGDDAQRTTSSSSTTSSNAVQDFRKPRRLRCDERVRQLADALAASRKVCS
ncbi:MAG: hypothetical protein ACLT98_06660 [Eggerthellaceae bacterium]